MEIAVFDTMAYALRLDGRAGSQEAVLLAPCRLSLSWSYSRTPSAFAEQPDGPDRRQYKLR